MRLPLRLSEKRSLVRCQAAYRRARASCALSPPWAPLCLTTPTPHAFACRHRDHDHGRKDGAGRRKGDAEGLVRHPLFWCAWPQRAEGLHLDR